MGFDSSNLRFMRSIAGGFNHFELRHYFRPYDLPDGNGGYIFREEDVNESMEYIREWIRNN